MCPYRHGHVPRGWGVWSERQTITMTKIFSLNSLAPGRFEQNFRKVIVKLISVTDGWVIFCKIALIWMSVDLTDDKSTLVQVMAWCRQATSHYLSQCWLRSMWPYGVTRKEWVKLAWLHGCEYFVRPPHMQDLSITPGDPFTKMV